MVAAFIELVLARQAPGMVVAEIGCFDGDSAMHWMPIVEHYHGWGILVDTFEGSLGVAAGDVHSRTNYSYSQVINTLTDRLHPFSKVAVFKADSAEVVRLVPNGCLDICFIDADHRYSQVSKDIDAWRPKVKPGGILCGHDCESLSFNPAFIENDYLAGNHHGVAKAVSERFPNVQLLGDAVWMVEL